jgi:hypothetical protein
MAWSASGMFRQTFIDIFDKALTTHDFDAAAQFKVALYNNSITPDFDVSAANSAYNAGQWATANEVTSATEWAAGGVVLASNDVTGVAGGIIMLDANDTASSAGATMSGIYGCLIYMDAVTTPVADQGLLAVYFGGTGYSVTSGTFTIQWNASGIARWDVA